MVEIVTKIKWKVIVTRFFATLELIMEKRRTIIGTQKIKGKIHKKITSKNYQVTK